MRGPHHKLGQFLLAVGLGFGGTSSPADTASVQFFGDLYLPQSADPLDTSALGEPFAGIDDLLKSATVNVVNFEGAATNARLAPVMKTWVLRMSPAVGELLKKAPIHVATLGNNHSLDLGALGLFDTMTSLQLAGIQTTGAGANLDEALRPAMVATAAGTACVLSFNRTYPSKFWAKANQPGSAFVSIDETVRLVRHYADRCDFVFPVFHWGEEMKTIPKPYQVMIAEAAIDAGAAAVIGHHPHVLQTIAIYRGKPILYSLGNFVFMTNPLHRHPEGVGAALSLDRVTKSVRKLTLTNLDVVGLTKPGVRIKPIAPTADLNDPVYRSLSAEARELCRIEASRQQWVCRFIGEPIAKQPKTSGAKTQGI